MTKKETEAQYNWAVNRVEGLPPLLTDETPLDNPNSIELELELLSNLVADYSDEHFAMKEPSIIDVMKFRMCEMNLTQNKLSELLNISSSHVSDYLSGKCEPTLKAVRDISKILNIDASIVLGV